MTGWQRRHALAALAIASALVVAGIAFGRGPNDPALLVVFVASVSLSGWFGGTRFALFISWLLAAAGSLAVAGANSPPAAEYATSRLAAFIGAGALLGLAAGVIRERRLTGRGSEPRPQVPEQRTVAVLQSTEKHFQRLAAAIPQILWSASAEGEPDYCNHTYYDPLGLTTATVLSKEGFAQAVHPEDDEQYRRAWSAALRSGSPGRVEYRLRVAIGNEYRWHACRFLPVRDATGQVERWFCTSTDIEDQKRVEAARQELLDRLEAAVEERTGELTRANAALSEEVRRREQAEAVRTGLLRRITTAQEDERSRIARELHDQMGQYLAALGVGLRVVGEDLPPDAPAAARLAHLRDLTDEVGRHMHRLAVELRPAALDDLGLQVAVQNYVEDWVQQTGLDVDFHLSGTDAPLPRAVEIVVYRVIQEALTNVIKHAEARRVGIVLRQACGHLQLIVDDDGRGFDAERMMMPSSAGRRLGLLGMAERVSQVGGRIEVNSEPGRGSEIVVRIPIGGDEGEPSCE